jgi:hypothetical protein
LRPKAVGELNGLAQNVPKNGPGEFLARPCHPTAVNRLSFRPQTATTSSSEKLTGFSVNALSLSTAADGEDESDELGQWKLSIPDEIGSTYLF